MLKQLASKLQHIDQVAHQAYPYVFSVAAVVLGAYLLRGLLEIRSAWKSKTSLPDFFYKIVIESGDLYTTTLATIGAFGILIPFTHARLLLTCALAAIAVLVFALHALVISAAHDHVFGQLKTAIINQAEAAEAKTLADATPVIEKAVEKAVFN